MLNVLTDGLRRYKISYVQWMARHRGTTRPAQDCSPGFNAVGHEIVPRHPLSNSARSASCRARGECADPGKLPWATKLHARFDLPSFVASESWERATIRVTASERPLAPPSFSWLQSAVACRRRGLKGICSGARVSRLETPGAGRAPSPSEISMGMEFPTSLWFAPAAIAWRFCLAKSMAPLRLPPIIQLETSP